MNKFSMNHELNEFYLTTALSIWKVTCDDNGNCIGYATANTSWIYDSVYSYTNKSGPDRNCRRIIEHYNLKCDLLEESIVNSGEFR